MLRENGNTERRLIQILVWVPCVLLISGSNTQQTHSHVEGDRTFLLEEPGNTQNRFKDGLKANCSPWTLTLVLVMVVQNRCHHQQRQQNSHSSLRCINHFCQFPNFIHVSGEFRSMEYVQPAHKAPPPPDVDVMWRVWLVAKLHSKTPPPSPEMALLPCAVLCCTVATTVAAAVVVSWTTTCP